MKSSNFPEPKRPYLSNGDLTPMHIIFKFQCKIEIIYKRSQNIFRPAPLLKKLKEETVQQSNKVIKKEADDQRSRISSRSTVGLRS